MKSMETGRQDGGSDKNHAPFSVGKTGNISRKFLTIILKIFDKNFERLHYDNEISAQSLSADEKYAIPDSVVETMVFHDEMNRYLKFIDSTLRVTAGRDGKEVPSGYYTVTASGSNAFQVEVDLVNLFNTGIIDYEDLTDENPITVTYEAVVTDDAIQGDELFNEAWVNDGEHDSVEGDVLDKKVPSTGGMGRRMFTGLGLLFMGTAAAAGKRKRSM